MTIADKVVLFRFRLCINIAIFLERFIFFIFWIMTDIYDKFVSMGEIYCDGCAALFVITMYVRLLTWSNHKHKLTSLDC